MKLCDWEPTEKTNNRNRCTKTSDIRIITQYKITMLTMLEEIFKRLRDINKEDKVIINDISDSNKDK